MHEVKWLSSDNPYLMLQYLSHQAEGLCDRKSRLFGCACARQIDAWGSGTRDLSNDPLISWAEAYADDDSIQVPSYSEEEVLRTIPEGLAALLPQRITAIEWSRMEFHYYEFLVKKADFVRDIFGNPFAHVTNYGELRSRGILDWHGETIPRLANRIYDERLAEGQLDDTALAVLADACEDAGLDEVEFVNALRGLKKVVKQTTRLGVGQSFSVSTSVEWVRMTVARYRGFWPVDNILGL